MDSLARSAFGPHLEGLALASGTGLAVGELTDAGIAAVMASPTRRDDAASRLTAFANAHLLHLGPAQWLLIAENPPASWLADLTEALDGTAKAFDQSAGYGLLTLRGKEALTVLQKGLFVDLDKALDHDGASLNSVLAHISVTVWRIAPELFGVAVPRSYAGSFWHWFEAATAAEAIRPGRAA